MPAPPTLTVISLGGGVQPSVMALMASQGAFDRTPDCATFADGPPQSRYHGGGGGGGAESWPGGARTPRAVAPPEETGDAVALYYSQTRSRQEAGLFDFRASEGRQ